MLPYILYRVAENKPVPFSFIANTLTNPWSKCRKLDVLLKYNITNAVILVKSHVCRRTAFSKPFPKII